MFQLDLDSLISLKVGEGDTEAQYRIGSPERVRHLLSSLIDNG